MTSPEYHILFRKRWLKLDENCCRCSLLQILKPETYAFPRTVSPTFSSVSLYNQPFSRYCISCNFPIDPHVKISKCPVLKSWSNAQKKRPVFSHGSQCHHKVWLRLDENCTRRYSVLKLPAPYCPVLTKFSKCHTFFLNLADRQKKGMACIPPPKYHNFHKVWLKFG